MTPAQTAAPGLVLEGHAWIRLLRVHHWSKNLLLFCPLAAAHRAPDGPLLLQALAAFLGLSLCASAGYIANDIIDEEADRGHAAKRNRPLASGALSYRAHLALAAVFATGGIAVATAVSERFALLVAAYMACSLLYTLYLKSVLLVDIFVLAGFYTFRIYSGGEAFGVRISFWLAAFSLFLFLSLAFVKRYAELRVAARAGASHMQGRGYRVRDIRQLGTAGMASAYAAVIVLALYIDSAEVRKSYSQPGYLWTLCIGLLYWVNRIWILANRDELTCDPVVFALRDRATYAIAGVSAALLWLAA